MIKNERHTGSLKRRRNGSLKPFATYDNKPPGMQVCIHSLPRPRRLR
jgi:hypothetical protein